MGTKESTKGTMKFILNASFGFVIYFLLLVVKKRYQKVNSITVYAEK